MKWNDVESCVSHCPRATQHAFDVAKRRTEDLDVAVSCKKQKYQAVFSAYFGQGHSVDVTITRKAKHKYTVSSKSTAGEKMPGFDEDTLKEIGKSFIRAVRKHRVKG